MEIMEDGNLADRVRILLQRDMLYYQDTQTVLRETLCTRISGGKLDFPRYASFAAIKIVTWWEADFLAAFERPSGLTAAKKSEISENPENDERVIKKIPPSEFVSLVIDTADELLEHLHLLIQESLDHADLTVLTATLGAAVLIRNCLWCYTQQAKNVISYLSSEKLNKSYKSYCEMAEAVAERLLDLHCRLISLYVLNEADSLNWNDTKPFFERERCSFVIQMWWLYMQGTKTDLWNSVSPKMAQRIYTGMLNESLTIIVTRFIYGRHSLARADQFWADAFNVLCCTGYLALAVCVNANEMIGMKLNKLPTAIRDIHVKCNELLICLLLRGTPLQALYQMFRIGCENLKILKSRKGPAPWLLICAPNLLGSTDSDVHISNLSEERTVILELNILRQQPQPNWPQLMKVLLINNYAVAKMILSNLIHKCGNFTSVDNYNKIGKLKTDEKGCRGFLCCTAMCDPGLQISPELSLYSITYILANVGQDSGHVIVQALKENSDWARYLDRQQVWNQSRPPWLNAILNPLKGMMEPIIEILFDAVKTGASMYQAMSLVIGCFTELYVTLPYSIISTALILNDNIPAHCHPVGDNVLLHILCASLYTVLFDLSKNCKRNGQNVAKSDKVDNELNSLNLSDISETVIALAESICSIDEENKHTTQIDDFFNYVKENVNELNPNSRFNELNDMSSVIEVYTDELLFTNSGRRALKVIHEYVIRASDLILNNLRYKNNAECPIDDIPQVSPLMKPLTYTMFNIEDNIFDQFLVQYEKTNWNKVLNMRLSVSIERVRSLLLLRPEFKNVNELSVEDRAAVYSIKRYFQKNSGL